MSRAPLLLDSRLTKVSEIGYKPQVLQPMGHRIRAQILRVQSCASGRRLTDNFSTAADKVEAQMDADADRMLEGLGGPVAAINYLVVSVLFTTSINTEVGSLPETTLTIIVTTSTFNFSLVHI